MFGCEDSGFLKDSSGLGSRLRESLTGAIGDFAFLKYFLNLRDSLSLWSLVTKGLVFRDVQLDVDRVNRQFERLWPRLASSTSVPICLLQGRVRKLQLSISLARGTTSISVTGLDVVLGYAREAEADRTNLDRFLVNLNAISEMFRMIACRELRGLPESPPASWRQRAINFWLKYDPRISVKVKDIHFCLDDQGGRWGLVLDSLAVHTRDTNGTVSNTVKDARVDTVFGFLRVYWSRHARAQIHFPLSVPADAIFLVRIVDCTVCLESLLTRFTSTEALVADSLNKSLVESPCFIERFVVSLVTNGPCVVDLSAPVLQALRKLTDRMRLSAIVAELHTPFTLLEPTRTAARQWKWVKECLARRACAHRKQLRCSRHRALQRKANRLVMHRAKDLWTAHVLRLIQYEPCRETALETLVASIRRELTASLDEPKSTIKHRSKSKPTTRLFHTRVRSPFDQCAQTDGTATNHQPAKHFFRSKDSSRTEPRHRLMSRALSKFGVLAATSHRVTRPRGASLAPANVALFLSPISTDVDREMLAAQLPREISSALKIEEAVSEYCHSRKGGRTARGGPGILSSADWATLTYLSRPTRVQVTAVSCPKVFAPNSLVHLWSDFTDRAPGAYPLECLDALRHSAVRFFDGTLTAKDAATRYSNRILLCNRLLIRSLMLCRIKPCLRPSQRPVELDLISGSVLKRIMQASEIAPCVAFRNKMLSQESQMPLPRVVLVGAPSKAVRADAFLREAEDLLSRAAQLMHSSDKSDDDTASTASPSLIEPSSFRPITLRTRYCGCTVGRLRMPEVTLSIALSREYARILNVDINGIVGSLTFDRKAQFALAIKQLGGSIDDGKMNSRAFQIETSARRLSDGEHAVSAVSLRLLLTPPDARRERKLHLSPPMAVTLTLNFNDIFYDGGPSLESHRPFLIGHGLPSMPGKARLLELFSGPAAAVNGLFRIRVRLPGVATPTSATAVASRQILIDTGRSGNDRAFRVTIDEEVAAPILQSLEGFEQVRSVAERALREYLGRLKLILSE